MEGILCFINITLGEETERRTTQLKTFKNFLLSGQVGARERELLMSDLIYSYSHGFLALVLQVFHLAERAEDWWTSRRRRTRREVDCIVLSRARRRLETDWRSGDSLCSQHPPPSSSLLPPLATPPVSH